MDMSVDLTLVAISWSQLLMKLFNCRSDATNIFPFKITLHPLGEAYRLVRVLFGCPESREAPHKHLLALCGAIRLYPRG